MPKSTSDIQAELQAALDQENADATSHAAAITQAISDISSLEVSAGADPVVSGVLTLQSGTTVDLTVTAAE